MVAELDTGDTLGELTEPFVLLSDEYSLSPAAGRALLGRASDDVTILAAMHAVLHGLAVQDEIHLAASEPTPGSHELTPREHEVFELLGEGFSNRQIAQALTISENTVKFHLSSLFSKLQVNSRAEAVSVGIRSGILML
jgi:DNA-binding NarL/FixJ family response regulator